MAKGRRQDNGRYGKVYENILTKDYLNREYTINQRGPYDIAKEIGCSVHIIYSYIDYHNIPRIEFKTLNKVESGTIFGNLQTIKVIGKTKNGTSLWECKCVCGNIANVPVSRLKCGRAKSCGCRRGKVGLEHYKWSGYCDISGSRISDIRLRAKKHNWDFDLNAEFLWKLYIGQDRRCAISGLPIIMNENSSLDRIDSSKGYTQDNVQWTLLDINRMKLDIPLDKFIDYCEAITKHKQGKETI